NVCSPQYLSVGQDDVSVGQGDVALRAGQCVDGGQRRAERRPVLRADPVQDPREPLGPHRPAPGQRVPALVGQPHLDHPPVGGGRPPAGPPPILPPPPPGRPSPVSPSRAISCVMAVCVTPPWTASAVSRRGPDRSSVASVAAAVADSPSARLSELSSPLRRPPPAAIPAASARSVPPAAIPAAATGPADVARSVPAA